MARTTYKLAVMAGIGLSTAGCLWGPHWHKLASSGPTFSDPAAATGTVPQFFENPLFVPIEDREFLWNQLVDAVDDNFRIEYEERVKFIDGILTEGRIDTYPAYAATLLEPWQRDSPSFRDRLQSTFQTIRRIAHLRVTPTRGGYWVHVTVQKELEELSQSEHATVGRLDRRYDGTLRGSVENPIEPTSIRPGPIVLGWIPLGRDSAYEQRMLKKIHARMFNYTQGG